jgi:hypothetical protein
MSKFNSYARKVNDIATAAFEEYRKTEQAYKKAEEQAKKYPQRMGLVDAQYAAKSARAQADFLEAKEEYRKAKATLESHKSEIAALRKKLAAELDDHYAADPAALDSNTLELMKSGVLKANEYAKLLEKAQSDGNYTMARMIAKYAGDAAKQRGSEYGQNDEQARTLRAISYTANQNNGNDTLQAFDLMADVYSRATNNPGMIDHWGELTGNALENM